MANDMVEEYLKGELQKLGKSDYKQGELFDDMFPKIRITWTGKKIDLIELLYALWKVGCINDGNISLNKMAAYFESVFNIGLGQNISRDFYDIRLRKNRKSFIERLKDKLGKHSDELDK